MASLLAADLGNRPVGCEPHSVALTRYARLRVQRVEVHAGRLYPDEPRDRAAENRSDDQAIKQGLGADRVEQDGKQERRHDGADLGEGSGKAGALAANGRWENLAGQ